MIKKILIDDDQITTLAELAKDLAKSHGWKEYEVDNGKGEIKFVSSEGVKCVVDTSGFAQRVMDDGTLEDWDDENVDWDEEFDGWSNHVWAEDEDGNTVMLHD